MKNISQLWIFGYGSIMLPSSAAQTLGRELKESDVLPAQLENFKRVWNLAAPVILQETPPCEVSAVFLNIERCPASFCNGILLKVSEQELASFDLREKQYDRIEVTDSIVTSVQGTIFAYIGKKEHTNPGKNSIVLGKYIEMIESALEYWGAEFKKQYNASTEKISFSIANTSYKFADTYQNKYTGR
jgi:cation transport regulator ChaC